MNRAVKIIVCLLLLASSFFFGWKFKTNYSLLMQESGARPDTDLINVRVPDYQRAAQPVRTDYHLGLWGGGLVASLVLLGLLMAHEVSSYLGAKTLKVLYNDDGTEGLASPDYEHAEQVWASGNYLEAIQLLREYLKANPREQHVALRIAEIYEKDLQNPLAAALEYEEVLKHNLPPERWGWAAIHLCNLYTGKLNNLDQAVALLRRIDAEYGETAAADKARKRLQQLETEGIIPPQEPGHREDSGSANLPPGFAPKKP